MTIQHYLKKAVFAAAVCAAMAGCASLQKPQPLTGDAYDMKLKDADAIWKSGDADRAIPLYQDLAQDDPTREEPWSRIAQIQFSQAHYGQAVVAAQEALQRDSGNRQARSIFAVSGLRLATQSLEQIREDSALAGDATADARILAQQLRHTLGEATLFPDEVKEDKSRSKKAVRRRARGRKTVSGNGAAPAGAKSGGGADGASGNPFGALK